jgi:hypothetical protein
LFIRKFIKRELYKFSTIIKGVFMKKNSKLKHQLSKENNFYLKIFFFEKSSIFHNFVSKNKSNKFSVKVYKNFYYFNKNLRMFYYITKGYYNFLLKNYNKNFLIKNNQSFNNNYNKLFVKQSCINNRFFYFLLSKNKSFEINFDNFSDNLF